MKNPIAFVMASMILAGCSLHKPVVVVTPEVKYVYVPVGQCDLGSFITDLKGLLSEQDLTDLSVVAPEDRVKMLCQLAANNQKLSSALEQLVGVLEQNQTDCQATLDELKKKSDSR